MPSPLLILVLLSGRTTPRRAMGSEVFVALDAVPRVGHAAREHDLIVVNWHRAYERDNGAATGAAE
ncbi:MAG: hypothetical protein U0269_11230 [Polyangiales bacterium]